MSRSQKIIKAAEVILTGGHILCPTDTVWGISADATNFEAVEQVFELKDRPKNKSMIVLVSSLDMLANYVKEVPLLALDFLKQTNHPSSIVYPEGKNLAQNVVALNGSVAIRIVKEGFCNELIQHLQKPLISTSANLSGDPSPATYGEISQAIKEGVNYCVNLNQAATKRQESSPIYLIEGDELKQIR